MGCFLSKFREPNVGATVFLVKMVRRPGIEPGPPAWKAGILTTELTTLLAYQKVENPGFDPGASSLLTTHSTD